MPIILRKLLSVIFFLLLALSVLHYSKAEMREFHAQRHAEARAEVNVYAEWRQDTAAEGNLAAVWP